MPEKNQFAFLGKAGFDSAKYIKAQAGAIILRASKFDKLYLEFGGKLIYDYHAARVLPGYRLGAKMEVVRKLAEKKPLEFLFCVSARDLEGGKKMGALGISYRDFSLKMLDSIKENGFEAPNVVINFFEGQRKAKEFGSFLKSKGYGVYYRGLIKGYPENIKAIASASGFGKKPFIKTKKPIVIVTGAGPNSGKMATCLAMVYQDYLQKKDSGYAKFESFPIWNLALASPINGAYEAATADLGDYNLIDPYHLKAYKIKAVNYNRDVENFDIIEKALKRIISPSNFMNSYRSPTDMGMNLMREGITDLALCEKAAKQEIVRRYFSYRSDVVAGTGREETVSRMEEIMRRYGVRVSDRPVVECAREAMKKAKGFRGMKVGSALMLESGEIIAGENSPHMHAESAAIINSLKRLAGISESADILPPYAIGQIRKLRKTIYEEESENLSIPEILIVLAISAKNQGEASRAFSRLGQLRSCELHTTHMLLRDDAAALRALGINFTSDGRTELGKMYIG